LKSHKNGFFLRLCCFQYSLTTEDFASLSLACLWKDFSNLFLFPLLGEALVATNDVIVTVTAAPEIYQPAPVTAAPSIYQPVVYFTEKPAVAEPVVFFTQKPVVADQVVYFTNQPAVFPIGPAVRPAYDQVPVVVSVFVTL
jgi:hypothetical protein